MSVKYVISNIRKKEGQLCGVAGKPAACSITWASVPIVGAPFPIQLLVNSLGKSTEDGPRVRGSAPHMGDLERAPGSSLISPSHYSHLGSESADGSFPPLAPISPSFFL